ncbi:hypothetical protein AKG11_32410, partial [Shinella sp. SUS2]|uniref:hypothetical protein n=1 Tax=unclassified Shinella TaxID=2643062 RepID=UPI0006A4F6AF
MQDNRTVVPTAMMEAVFNSNHAAGLIPGRDTHLPAFHFVGEIVPHTQEVAWILDIVGGFLPPDYKGNTLEEIPRMVADSIKNGYVTPTSGNKQPSAAETGLIRRLADFDSLAFPKWGESESLVQTGG